MNEKWKRIIKKIKNEWGNHQDMCVSDSHHARNLKWGDLKKWSHLKNIMLMRLCAETWPSPMVKRSIVVKNVTNIPLSNVSFSYIYNTLKIYT